MFCMNCGASLPEGAKFCVNCGTAQTVTPTERFCEQCGSPIEPGNTFCAECGNRLKEKLQEKIQEKAEEKLEEWITDALTPDSQPAAASVPDPASAPVSSPVAAPAPAMRPASAAPVAPAAAPAAPTVNPAAASVPVRGSAPGAASAPNTTMTAAPAVSAAPAAAVSRAASAAAPVAASVAGTVTNSVSTAAVVGSVAATAAVGAAKTGMSAAKRVVILALAAAFLIGGFSAWIAVFVGSPEDTTEQFFSAAQAMDFDGMLSCMDPGTEKQVRAMLNLAGGIFGSLTGVDLDFEALASLAPGLVPYMDMDQQMRVLSVETILYSDDSVNTLFKNMASMSEAELEQYLTANIRANGNYMANNAFTDFLAKYNLMIPGIAKLTAKSALVKAELIMGGETQTLYLPLQNEGWGDWRIYLNLNLLSALPV